MKRYQAIQTYRGYGQEFRRYKYAPYPDDLNRTYQWIDALPLLDFTNFSVEEYEHEEIK